MGKEVVVPLIMVGGIVLLLYMIANVKPIQPPSYMIPQE